jgi:hypothetical protein
MSEQELMALEQLLTAGAKSTIQGADLQVMTQNVNAAAMIMAKVKSLVKEVQSLKEEKAEEAEVIE